MDKRNPKEPACKGGDMPWLAAAVARYLPVGARDAFVPVLFGRATQTTKQTPTLGVLPDSAHFQKEKGKGC